MPINVQFFWVNKYEFIKNRYFIMKFFIYNIYLEKNLIMSKYGFYSQKQENIAGYLSCRNTNFKEVVVTEISEFETKEEAHAYFENDIKVRLPDSKWVGPVTDVVRISHGNFPGKSAIVRTLLMGKRVECTSRKWKP